MPWTEITRPHHQRATRGYASDLTDAEWALLRPFMPQPSRLGRPRKTDLRRVVEALRYIGSTGCQWRQLPKDFPPYSTVQGYFYAWAEDATLMRINHALVMAVREVAGREATLRWLSTCCADGTFASSARLPASSTANRSRPPRLAARAAMMPERRSKAASAISPPTPWATWSEC